MRTVRLVLWGIVAVAATVVLVFNAWYDAAERLAYESAQDRSTAFYPSFSLTDHQGNSVTEQSFRGQWLLVFFGFTFCPDICPTTLSEMAQVMDRLGSDVGSVTPLFISIDPERDNVEAMEPYVSAFHATIVGLTGTERQIAQAASAFEVYYEKQPQDSAPNGYTMAHTSAVYLVSPEGRFVRTYGYGTSPEEIFADLRNRI